MSEPLRSEGAVTACSEAVLPAPRVVVWQFFLDIPRSTRCLPGVHDVEQLDERTYRGTVRFRAGFLPLTFQATVELREVVPPERIRLTARARDPLTGEEVIANALAELCEVDTSRTLLRYAFTV
ncbi:MAG: CoxG family protein, partial [Thermomicrobium sp.]